MSVDKLQKKIRKMKSPIMVDFSIVEEDISPDVLSQEGAFLHAYEKVCRELMDGLQEFVPAVRFNFTELAVFGPEGFAVLERLLAYANDKDYFVLLEGLEPDKPAAIRAAMAMPCDGLSLSPYTGSDHIKAYCQFLNEGVKSLFVTLRTPNRSASEIQDLMTGSRLVHQAAADVLSRLGEGYTVKCGYTQIAGVAAANSVDSIRTLRAKYNRLFLLVDGYDYSNANAKNCSYAFDQFGHGAVVCSGTGITAAWKERGCNVDYVEAAIEAAKKMQKNILRYISIL